MWSDHREGLANGGGLIEEQISARKDPLFTGPIEHHDKRTLTVGGACESVQNHFRSFPYRHRRRVYVFAFTSLPRDNRGVEKKKRKSYLCSLSIRIHRRGARGLVNVGVGWQIYTGRFVQTKTKRGEKENEGFQGRRIFTAWHFGLVVLPTRSGETVHLRES